MISYILHTTNRLVVKFSHKFIIIPRFCQDHKIFKFYYHYLICDNDFPNEQIFLTNAALFSKKSHHYADINSNFQITKKFRFEIRFVLLDACVSWLPISTLTRLSVFQTEIECSCAICNTGNKTFIIGYSVTRLCRYRVLF